MTDKPISMAKMEEMGEVPPSHQYACTNKNCCEDMKVKEIITMPISLEGIYHWDAKQKRYVLKAVNKMPGSDLCDPAPIVCDECGEELQEL